MKNYGEWAALVPDEVKGDSLWRVEAYRLGLFVADLGWHDVTKLVRDNRTLRLSDQLYRALGSISANVAEGYSRGTGKDRARSRIARDSTNTPLALPGRVAIGATKPGTSWAKPSPSIALVCSPRSSVFF